MVSNVEWYQLEVNLHTYNWQNVFNQPNIFIAFDQKHFSREVEQRKISVITIMHNNILIYHFKDANLYFGNDRKQRH